MRTLVMTGALILILSGCAALQPAADDSGAIAELLARYRHVAAQPTEEQQAELVNARRAYEHEAGEYQRLRLALAQYLPRLPWPDESGLSPLLGPVLIGEGNAVSAKADLARVLLRVSVERPPPAAEVHRVEVAVPPSLREEPRRQDAALKEEIRRLDTAWRDEQRRSQELQQKLDALLSIERDLRRRPSTR